MLFARERATMSFDEWLDRRIHHTELDALIDLSGAGLKIGMLPSRVLPWRGRNFAGDARTSPVAGREQKAEGDRGGSNFGPPYPAGGRIKNALKPR